MSQLLINANTTGITELKLSVQKPAIRLKAVLAAIQLIGPQLKLSAGISSRARKHR